MRTLCAMTQNCSLISALLLAVVFTAGTFCVRYQDCYSLKLHGKNLSKVGSKLLSYRTNLRSGGERLINAGEWVDLFFNYILFGQKIPCISGHWWEEQRLAFIPSGGISFSLSFWGLFSYFLRVRCVGLFISRMNKWFFGNWDYFGFSQ